MDDTLKQLRLREAIEEIHDRLHGRQRTHKEVAKHSDWTKSELEHVLKEDEWLFEGELMSLLSQHTQRARAEAYDLLYWKYKEINGQSVDIKFAEAYGILKEETNYEWTFYLPDEESDDFKRGFRFALAQLSTKDSTNKEDV